MAEKKLSEYNDIVKSQIDETTKIVVTTGSVKQNRNLPVSEIIEDSLNSDNPLLAASANQAKILNEKKVEKAFKTGSTTSYKVLSDENFTTTHKGKVDALPSDTTAAINAAIATAANDATTKDNVLKELIQANADAISGVANGHLGTVSAADTSGPRPGKSGLYTFSTAGTKPTWLTSTESTVKIGDEVSVKYTAGDTPTYTYVHINNFYELSNSLSSTSETTAASSLAVNLLANLKVDRKVADIQNDSWLSWAAWSNFDVGLYVAKTGEGTINTPIGITHYPGFKYNVYVNGETGNKFGVITLQSPGMDSWVWDIQTNKTKRINNQSAPFIISNMYYTGGAQAYNTSFSTVRIDRTQDYILLNNITPNDIEFVSATGTFLSGHGFGINLRKINNSTYLIYCNNDNCKYISINFQNSLNSYSNFSINQIDKTIYSFNDKLGELTSANLVDDRYYSNGSLLANSSFKCALSPVYGDYIYVNNGQPNNVEYLNSSATFISGGDFANDKIEKVSNNKYRIKCDVNGAAYVGINFVNTSNTYTSLLVKGSSTKENASTFDVIDSGLYGRKNIQPGKVILSGNIVGNANFSLMKLSAGIGYIHVEGGIPNNVEYISSGSTLVAGGDYLNGKIVKIDSGLYRIDTNVTGASFVYINFVNSQNNYSTLRIVGDSDFSLVGSSKSSSLSSVWSTTSSLAGYTVGVVGDSIGTGAICSNPAMESFGALVANRFGAKVNLNTSKAGYCYGDVAGSANADVLNPVNGQVDKKGLYYYLLSNITRDEKFFILQAGTNDHGLSIPIGETSVLTNGVMEPNFNVQTTVGGLNTLIRDIYNNMGHIPILLMTPIHKNFYTQTAPFDFSCSREVNSAGKTLSDYADAIKKVGAYWNIPVLDLFTVADMNPYLEDVYKKFFYEGIHPNTNGHRRMFEVIHKYIISNMSIPITVQGVVVDSLGAAVSGASVSIAQGNSNPAITGAFAATTDSNGLFKINDISRDVPLTISISKSGYTALSKVKVVSDNDSSTYTLTV